jgi:EAL domain-containing protein (putative c-di-GMP-specific phosphodiesterase class I)
MRYTFIFQPISDGSQPVAYEILVRGVSQDNELLPSLGVLEWAKEELDRLRQIDLDALELAIALIPQGITSHVNVSEATVGSVDYFKRLGEILISGLNPAMIAVEISEEIEPTPEVQVWITQVRDMGFGIWMDDYGYWHSNDTTRVRYKPTGIKIDGQIVRGVSDIYYAGVICKELLFCKEYDLECVAEHVENVLIFNALKRICDRIGYNRLHYQGWYFGTGDLCTVAANN